MLYIAFAPPHWLLDYITNKTGVIFHLQADKTIYLTIDDAPSEWTHIILEELHEQQANFFVIGEYARNNPRMLRTIAEKGHNICNHDMKNRASALSNKEQIKEGIEGTDKIMRDILPEEQHFLIKKYFRPGCGLINKDIINVCKDLGYKIILGDSYAHDCQMQLFPRFLKWFYSYRSQSGSIVIMHDGAETRARNTAAVIKTLREDGFKFLLLPN